MTTDATLDPFTCDIAALRLGQALQMDDDAILLARALGYSVRFVAVGQVTQLEEWELLHDEGVCKLSVGECCDVPQGSTERDVWKRFIRWGRMGVLNERLRLDYDDDTRR